MDALWFGTIGAKQWAATMTAKMLSHDVARICAVAKSFGFTLPSKA
jgi:hypothetical protein